MHVVPLGFEIAVAVEDLDAVVLPVGDIDPAVRVAGDVVRDVELSGIGPGLPQPSSNLPSGEYLCTRALP